MGNKSSNPFVSTSSKPDYFHNYKFDHFCFEIYDGIEPDINSRYPTSQYDGIVYLGDDVLVEIIINTIHLTKDEYSPYEMIWLIKSKSDSKLFKPIYKEDKVFCSWLDLIYSWVDTKENPDSKENANNQMYPLDKSFTDYYITRKVFLEQDPETPNLKMWAGKTHYIEWVGGPEPAPTCACCGQTRVNKPSGDELVNSTKTDFDIKQKDYGIKFNSDHFKLYLDTGVQISAYIDYHPKENKLILSWKHWTHPANSLCYYATFYKGKFFEKSKGCTRLKYYYPEWVKDDTIWYVRGFGESSADMFPELSKKDLDLKSEPDIVQNSNTNPNHNYINKTDTKSLTDYSNHLCYTDCVTNSINLSSNQFVGELFELVDDLWNEIKQFIPDDIIGNLFDNLDKLDNSDKKTGNNFDINKTIRYSGLEDLDLLRTELIEYFNQLDQDDPINILTNKLENFNPSVISELFNEIYTSTPVINNLINKYSIPVTNSSDVLIYCMGDYFDKKVWVGKTIVFGNLVKIIKEVHIQNESVLLGKKNNKGRFFINGIEQNEEPLDYNTNIIVDTEEKANAYAYGMIMDLVKNTWPDKNIIKYEKEDAQISESKYKYKEEKPIEFKILSWIREKNNN
jgi:hypothetical protein